MFDQFQNNEIVWITFINVAYIEFAMNFLESMKLSNCKFKLIIFCVDKEIIDRLQSYDNCYCIDAKVFLRYTVSSEKVQWEEFEYIKLNFAKLDVMLYAKKMLITQNVKYIGYVDTDIILFSDPMIMAKEYIDKYPDSDFIFQCDEGHTVKYCSNPTRCPDICAGFILIKNNPETNYLLEYTEADYIGNTSDQSYLNRRVKQFNINYVTFDRTKCMNGAHNNAFKLPIQKDLCLLHFNYLKGNDTKKEKMKKMNVWYLDK